MLNAKQLLVETAKFFKTHPTQWIRGSLISGSTHDVRKAKPTDCFCTVGYMAYLIGKENPELIQSLGPYNAVAEYMGGDISFFTDMNDEADSVDVVVDGLIERFNEC